MGLYNYFNYVADKMIYPGKAIEIFIGECDEFGYPLKGQWREAIIRGVRDAKESIGVAAYIDDDGKHQQFDFSYAGFEHDQRVRESEVE